MLLYKILAYLLKQGGSQVKVPLHEIFQQFNPNTWAVLKYINENPEVSLIGIRKELNLSQIKAEKEIARLEGSFFIKTERNPVDQRLMLYRITEYGLEALKQNP